ncbi:Lactase-like protein, partial [Larimichthys crocea]
AHAKVWHTYDMKWRGKQKGLIGISLTADWGEPVDNHQPEGHRSSREIHPVLHWDGLLLPSSMETTSGYERLHRQEEWPAGPGSFSAARLLASGEELRQGNLRFFGPRTFHYALRHHEELPSRRRRQLLRRS